MKNLSVSKVDAPIAVSLASHRMIGDRSCYEGSFKELVVEAEKANQQDEHSYQ